MPGKKIGLAISGGGYRASLYALGSLWRLNEFGLLKKLHTITSVSGGSITSGYLALHWDALFFDTNGIATNFVEQIANPLYNFFSTGIDIKAGLSGLFSFRDTIGDKIAEAYDKHLFNHANIKDIPSSAPQFIFYGTNYQTGSSIRIQKEKIHDYKIGEIYNPDIRISKAIAISSAFPPFLSPVTLSVDKDSWVKTQWASLNNNTAIKSRMMLTDGGLYDNLGLEAIWKTSDDFDYILACDAGAPLPILSKIRTNWISQLMRMNDIMIEQQRALRKRMLISNFQAIDNNGDRLYYGGTYFGISTKINEYNLSDAMASDSNTTSSLKHIRTRLNPFSESEKCQLINWGYAVTDAAIRAWTSEVLDSELNKPGSWPYERYSF